MLPLQLLALAVLLPAESSIPDFDPMPDWLQRELRGQPPTSMANTSTPSYAPPRPPQPTSYVQGLLGITELTVRDINLDSGLGSFESQEDATLPLIGGAVQRVLTGEKLHLGVEGGFLMGWMGDADAVFIGGGGVAIATDNDVFYTEGFAGLYADLMLGDKMRLYGGAGGLIDWAHMSLEYSAPIGGYTHVSGDGFGFGLYTRVGFDFPVQSGMRVGFCWRYFESDIDFGGEIDDVEVDGMQYMLTFTQSM
jgi:hypothetical protein